MSSASGLVHLVGSVPLSGCEQAFRRMSKELVPYLRRIPDGEAGDRRRIETARRFIAEFGIAGECGWGRTAPARLAGLLGGHRVAAVALGKERGASAPGVLA
jgi:hypothetical protein